MDLGEFGFPLKSGMATDLLAEIVAYFTYLVKVKSRVAGIALAAFFCSAGHSWLGLGGHRPFGTQGKCLCHLGAIWR